MEPIGGLRAKRGGVPLRLSMAISMAADDSTRRSGILYRHGVSDADVHRRTARYAFTLLGPDSRNGTHVVSDAGRVGRAALCVAGRGTHALQSSAGDANVLQGV